MLNVIILEDHEHYQVTIRASIPEGIQYVLVATSSELQDLLPTTDATLFFLDDNVPISPNGHIDYYFLSNAAAIQKSKPDAKIWYTGSMPGRKEESFCNTHGIPMIPKNEIGQTLKDLLEKSQ
ncbi:MAG: hypothetical protein KBD00_00160 [Candidatus Peribacteraceae bacterium]|nr:hypothetical protein [Candidatus Peribacteraceae bacterium]